MKYVLIQFTDGDARVYRKRAANVPRIKQWNAGRITAKVVHEDTDKDVLLAMAKLLRYEFVMKYPYEQTADYTDHDKFL